MTTQSVKTGNLGQPASISILSSDIHDPGSAASSPYINVGNIRKPSLPGQVHNFESEVCDMQGVMSGSPNRHVIVNRTASCQPLGNDRNPVASITNSGVAVNVVDDRGYAGEESESYTVMVRNSPGKPISKPTNVYYPAYSLTGKSPPSVLHNHAVQASGNIQSCNRTGPRLALYRSNSSLDLVEKCYHGGQKGRNAGNTYTNCGPMPTNSCAKIMSSNPADIEQRNPSSHGNPTGCFSKRKDFGSHGSIDVLSNGNPMLISRVPQASVPTNPSGFVKSERSCSVGSTSVIQWAASVARDKRGSFDLQQEKGCELSNLREAKESPRPRPKFSKFFEKGNHTNTAMCSNVNNANSNSYSGAIGGNVPQLPSDGKSKPEIAGLFRKLRGTGSSSRVNMNSKSVEGQFTTKSDGTLEEDDTKVILRHNSTSISDEKYRRRVFAHYDCQSITANITYAAKLKGILSRRRNTTTGASAASLAQTRPNSSPFGIENLRITDGGSDSESSCSSQNFNSIQDGDVGDGKTNALVSACPYFRNEVGGEIERRVNSSRNLRRGSKNFFRHVPNAMTGSSVQESCHRPPEARSISILEFSNGKSHWSSRPFCPDNASHHEYSLEAVDLGAIYYRDYFYRKDHENWFGSDENLGPLAISIRREPVESSCSEHTKEKRFIYRLIVRSTELNTLRGSIAEESVPGIKPNSKGGSHAKEVIEFLLPEIQLSSLRLGENSELTQEQLLKLDQQILTRRHKVGIMYCKSGQGTEEEMYNNEDAGAAFEEFLSLIGKNARLKDFNGYTGGLDNKDDSTGLYSVYVNHQGCEIMFHVSTLLPFTPNNRQQLMRKRHIGNDIVTIVFQEPGALPFTPKNIRSQFQHVFIVVRALNPCSESTQYSVSVSRSREVPLFGPPIPEGGKFNKGKDFVNFLLAKVINAENATYRSEKFTTMATRTRQEYLKDLVANYSTNTPIEVKPKFSIPSFSSKKKDLSRSHFNGDRSIKGSLSWTVLVEDHLNNLQKGKQLAFIGISSDSLVIIDSSTREPIFAIPCTSVLGWNSTIENCLRIYYHQGECLTVYSKDSGSREDLREILNRLENVTQGCDTKKFSLCRNDEGQLGFHVQEDGVVIEVKEDGCAAEAGLSKGSRLVEICNDLVASLSEAKMIDILKSANNVVVMVVPPLPDGKPRRGCDEKHCLDSSEKMKYENVHLNGVHEDESFNNGVSGGGQISFKTSEAHLHSSHSKESTMSNKNHRKRYEARGFSPPRSSNSSGYGTGSSSKSFSGAVDPNYSTTLESDNSLSSKHSEAKWYESLESASTNSTLRKDVDDIPPPIPARTLNSLNYYGSKTVSSPSSMPATPLKSASGLGELNQKFKLKSDVFNGNGSCQRGSFLTKLSASRSHDMLHMKNSLRPVNSMQLDDISGGPGGLYDNDPTYAKAGLPNVEDNFIKSNGSKYFLEFPLTHSQSTDHIPPAMTAFELNCDKDLEARNKRLAVLKSTYLDKHNSKLEDYLRCEGRGSEPGGKEIKVDGRETSGNFGSMLSPLSGTAQAECHKRNSPSPTKLHVISSDVKLRSNATRGQTLQRTSTLEKDLIRLITPDTELNGDSTLKAKSKSRPVSCHGETMGHFSSIEVPVAEDFDSCSNSWNDNTFRSNMYGETSVTITQNGSKASIVTDDDCRRNDENQNESFISESREHDELQARVSRLEEKLKKEQYDKKILQDKVANLENENQRLQNDQFKIFKEWLVTTVQKAQPPLESS